MAWVLCCGGLFLGIAAERFRRERERNLTTDVQVLVENRFPMKG
jgi:hypothetical protein